MKTCNKNCFESKKAANDEVKLIKSARIFRSKKVALSRDSAKSNGKMMTYYCELCDAWHLSTMPANVNRIIKKKQRRNNR